MSLEFSYLNQEQRESLEGLPFAILLPAEIPEGWSVSTLDFEEDEEDGASFTLGFTSPSGGTLNLLTASSGIGDPVGGERTSRHNHPELGEIKVEHEEDGDFLSDWVEIESGWSAVGGSGVTDEELDAIIGQLVAS